MKFSVVLLLTLGCSLVWPAGSWGQQPSVYEAGAIVRIDSPGYTPGRIAGVVQGYTHEGLILEDAATGTIYRIPRGGDIRYLAHYRPLNGWGSAKKYALPTGVVLGSIGAVGGPFLAVANEDERLLMWSGMSAAVGAIAGALVGGSLGAVFGNGEWKVYGLPRLQGSASLPIGVQLSVPVR